MRVEKLSDDVVLYCGDCLEVMAELEVNSVDAVAVSVDDITTGWYNSCMENISDLQVGKAGEYLVCADLILRGYIAFPSEQGLSYDVVVDIDGKLLRGQVKTTRTIRSVPQRKAFTPAYLFHIRRCGKGGRRSYDGTELDFMALVALDTKMIAYIKIEEAKQSIHLNVEKMELLSDFKRVLV